MVALIGALLAGCADHASSGGPNPDVTRGVSKAPHAPLARVRRLASVRLTGWRLPYAVARAAVVPLGRGSVILAGGLLPGDLSTDRAVRLDVGTGLARSLPPLAVAVHDTAAGLVGGVPTVVGGGNATEQSVMQSLARRHWRPVGNLPTTRSDLGVVEWRGRAYVVGGYDGASVPRAILRLSPRAAPRPVATLGRGVRYAAMARIGAHVYVFGGEVGGRELDTVQDVDLA